MKIDLTRPEISASGYRFAVVVSRWNDELTSRLAAGASDALEKAGAAQQDIELFSVPGAFELPLACRRAASTGRFDAVVALGVVIRGETPHFDYVAGQAAAGIMSAGLEKGVPILFGVITADTVEQAIARAGDEENNKGHESALSAVEMADLFYRMEMDDEERFQRFLERVNAIGEA